MTVSAGEPDFSIQPDQAGEAIDAKRRALSFSKRDGPAVALNRWTGKASMMSEGVAARSIN
jgi:hypothetical protein